MKHAFLALLVLTLTACFAPVDVAPPPTTIFSATAQPNVPTLTAIPATSAPDDATLTSVAQPTESLNQVPAILTSAPENFNSNFCLDTRALKLLSDLQTAIQSRDGKLLASLASPTFGVGVRFIRNAKVVTYFDNIKFIFETTYQADWGLGASSGEPVKGSFHDLVLPSLDLVFASNPIITCNELKVGGATYIPEWPYTGMDYYSVYYPGTDEFGGLNWETWAVGMVREEGKPMLAALVHYVWEP